MRKDTKELWQLNALRDPGLDPKYQEKTKLVIRTLLGRWTEFE